MKKFDRTNAVLAAFVFLFSFVVYAMTVQHTFSFWDCGEFVACAKILGIPHPPGTPLFVLLGRIFSIIPFVADISYRINYISVISSAITAMLAYLLTVKLVGYFFSEEDRDKPLNRIIAYVGGIVGGFFVAFSETNWGNSVEAEVYGLALALMLLIAWLAIRFFELRGTAKASRIMVLVFYLGMVGIGVHMTVYLIIPIAAIFFILNKDATPWDYAIVCGWVILELILIMLFSNGRGGVSVFYLVTGLLGLVVLAMLYRKINWAVLIAIGALSSVMIAFSLFLKMAPVAIVVLLILGYLSEKYKWSLHWKSALAVLFMGLMGFSVHMYIPIRSALNPRIDENNPSRSFATFVDFLDRKQYGQTSMVKRMFERRGTWENQFGRHPNMGFWSYFEEQYAGGGWHFIPFFLFGLLGLYVSMRKRMEIGIPFFTLFIICSAGLILYMNFADGTKYNFSTGDAYLEVRNRDYFFTPAFVFFGVAIGMGVSAFIKIVSEWVSASNPALKKTVVYPSIVLVLLSIFPLENNFHVNDRSKNYLPRVYAKNILDTCEPNTIIFTTGDNDTFPVWALQEVYDYRKDVRVVNLSLLNTDWYVRQMKEQYNVPISLTDEQILWFPFEVRPGIWSQRPKVPFNDRPRGVRTYLQAYQDPNTNQIVRVADMMVDEIVLEDRWKDPIFFSSPPYASSPLKLRDRATRVGMLYRLDRQPPEGLFDVDKTYDLFMNTYSFQGMENSEVYRDDNATGMFMALGSNAVLLFDELNKRGDTTKALALANKIIEEYPEYAQTYMVLAEYYNNHGDSAKATQLTWQLHDTLTAFLATSKGNLDYMQDLGMTKIQLGQQTGDSTMIVTGYKLVWDGFAGNANDPISFRKLATVLIQGRKFTELQKAAEMFGEYKRNLQDPFLQQLLGRRPDGVPSEPIEP